MYIEKGNLIIGHWQYVPIKLHWTILLTAFLFGRFEFVPIFWIAFFVLLFIHEAGHAMMIKFYRLWVDEIVIHGLGGYCLWAGEVEEIKKSLIALGGAFSQLIILIIALVSTSILGPAKNSMQAQIYHAFIPTNMLILVLNFVPIEPFDGAQAWKIFIPVRDFIFTKLSPLKRTRQFKTVQNQFKKIMRIIFVKIKRRKKNKK
jgi:Zn-dependent protease